MVKMSNTILLTPFSEQVLTTGGLIGKQEQETISWTLPVRSTNTIK